MDNRHEEKLAEFVSPSDFPLFDLAVSAIDDLTTISAIFADRNSEASTKSFILGLIKSLIASLTDKNVDCQELIDFINESEDIDDKE